MTGSNRGLKTTSRFYVQNTGTPANFSLSSTETFGYDADLDYLTSANYGDGTPDPTPSWTYDSAGNRNDTSGVDNLNRAASISGVSYTHDILGNRTGKSYGGYSHY